MIIGETISHYRVVELLGAGGMGEVFKAEDTRLKRPVALKFLPLGLTQDGDAKQRLLHEAQAASALDHPNICTIFEIEETPEGPCSWRWPTTKAAPSRTVSRATR